MATTKMMTLMMKVQVAMVMTMMMMVERVTTRMKVTKMTSTLQVVSAPHISASHVSYLHTILSYRSSHVLYSAQLSRCVLYEYMHKRKCTCCKLRISPPPVLTPLLLMSPCMFNFIPSLVLTPSPCLDPTLLHLPLLVKSTLTCQIAALLVLLKQCFLPRGLGPLVVWPSSLMPRPRATTTRL